MEIHKKQQIEELKIQAKKTLFLIHQFWKLHEKIMAPVFLKSVIGYRSLVKKYLRTHTETFRFMKPKLLKQVKKQAVVWHVFTDGMIDDWCELVDQKPKGTETINMLKLIVELGISDKALLIKQLLAYKELMLQLTIERDFVKSMYGPTSGLMKSFSTSKKNFLSSFCRGMSAYDIEKCRTNALSRDHMMRGIEPYVIAQFHQIVGRDREKVTIPCLDTIPDDKWFFIDFWASLTSGKLTISPEHDGKKFDEAWLPDVLVAHESADNVLDQMVNLLFIWAPDDAETCDITPDFLKRMCEHMFLVYGIKEKEYYEYQTISQQVVAELQAFCDLFIPLIPDLDDSDTGNASIFHENGEI